MAGVQPSPDGRSTAVLGTDGKWGIWPLDGSGLRPIPGLDSNYRVSGWSPDGESLYVVSTRQREKTRNVSRVNTVTGKMELWRTFGEGLGAGAVSIGGSYRSGDGGAYAYLYALTLSTFSFAIKIEACDSMWTSSDSVWRLMCAFKTGNAGLALRLPTARQCLP